MRFPSTLLLLPLPLVSSLSLPFKLPAQFASLQGHLSSLLHLSPPDSPLLALHRDLISIPSVSYNESDVAAFLASYLTTRNFTVELQSVPENRTNIYAYPFGTRASRVLLTSHIDTVPPFIPYSYSASTGKIHGRGSNDAKGSVAAQITAVEELIASNSLEVGDVALLYVVGEEVHGDGMHAANALGVGKDLKWDTVIFGEPTEGKLAVGHKGMIMLVIRAEGKASHSGYPHLGINANSRLISALAKLDNLELPAGGELGNSTLNIGLIEGGVASNVIPSEAHALIAVRVAGDLDETVEAIKEAMGEFEVTLEFSDENYGPVYLDSEVEGFETVVCAYGTDVPHLHTSENARRYLYGPGSILTAHGDNEVVTVKELEAAVEGYRALVMEGLGKGRRVPAVVSKNPVAEEKDSEERVGDEL